MDIFGQYKSPLGYTLGTNNIDTYGVDHSGFSTRDEVAYQTARQQRENRIMQNYNGQGITQDYPQYDTDFWGSSPENNYGFGVSNITPNVENMQNTPVPDSLAKQNSVIHQPYIFSKEMRDRLGFLESRGNYRAHNTSGGGTGALGKYQIRRGGLIDTGYINSENKWLGKNSIYSQEDFFNSPDKQEQILDDYLKSNYQQLKNKGALNYLGNRIQGSAGAFNITDTGLLAASHREGAGAVNRYLNNLEKSQNNSYYMNYNKIRDSELVDMFKRIETRLRKFEK